MKRDKLIKMMLIIAILLQLATTGFMTYTLITAHENFNVLDESGNFLNKHIKVLFWVFFGLTLLFGTISAYLYYSNNN
jgi:preprotein translocase subunit SecG